MDSEANAPKRINGFVVLFVFVSVIAVFTIAPFLAYKAISEGQTRKVIEPASGFVCASAWLWIYRKAIAAAFKTLVTEMSRMKYEGKK
jgi:hypothetical protein